MNYRRLAIFGVVLLALVTLALIGYTMTLPTWNAVIPGDGYYKTVNGSKN